MRLVRSDENEFVNWPILSPRAQTAVAGFVRFIPEKGSPFPLFQYQNKDLMSILVLFRFLKSNAGF